MPVLYEKRDNVGWITLSRPGARNAWGPDYYEGLAQYFEEMEEDDDVRCVVITGDLLVVETDAEDLSLLHTLQEVEGTLLILSAHL